MNSSVQFRASNATPTRSRHATFVTTRWSIVVAAAKDETASAQEALASLCQTYWYPLYGFVRARGYSREEAEDLTQEFFARLLQRHWLGAANREKGRFRSFLLTAMKRFLSDEWDKARAQKRGGGARLLPLEFDSAETRLSREPADAATPEQHFERRWALTLLAQVLEQLRAEYEHTGNATLFADLHPCLVGERAAQPYADLATKLQTTESAVKSAVHRLRRRYRELLRREIAETVAAPGEVDVELRHLLAVLGGGG